MESALAGSPSGVGEAPVGGRPCSVSRVGLGCSPRSVCRTDQTPGSGDKRNRHRTIGANDARTPADKRCTMCSVSRFPFVHRVSARQHSKNRCLQIALMVALGLLVGSASCSRRSSPLGPIAGESIVSITISDGNGHSTILDQSGDIQFVSSQLASLPTRREGKVAPEFELTFRTSKGSVLHLRLDSSCVGPNVPASDVVTRWYFENRALYTFLAGRLSMASARPKGAA